MIRRDPAIASREARRDLAAGALSVALAGFLSAVHFRQTGRLHEDYGAEPGPALLPEILLTALALIGLALLIRGFWTGRTAGLSYRWEKEIGRGTFGRASLVVLALLAAAMFLQSVTGFGIAAATASVLLAILLARQELRPFPRAAFEGFLVAATLYAMFRFVLGVPLT